MINSNFISYLLDCPSIYNFLIRCHHGKIVGVIKKEMLIKEGDWILDFGCGPGVNVRLFKNSFYAGVDKNIRYITYAKTKFPKRNFVVADICQSFGIDAKFDWILGNCIFHNLSDEKMIYALNGLKLLLKKSGKILIIDLLMPKQNNYLGRFMVSLDRGKYPRSATHYEGLFLQKFSITKKCILKIWWWDFCVFLMDFK